MYYKIKNKKAKEILSEIMARLESIEVKGDSVENLYIVKLGMKQILNSLEEISEEKEEKTKDEGG